MSISTVTTYTPPRPPYLRCGLRRVPMSTRARAPSTAGLSTPTRLRLLRFDGTDAHLVLATPTWVARTSRCSASESPLLWAPSPPPDCHGLHKCFHVARYARLSLQRTEVWHFCREVGGSSTKPTPTSTPHGTAPNHEAAMLCRVTAPAARTPWMHFAKRASWAGRLHLALLNVEPACQRQATCSRLSTSDSDMQRSSESSALETAHAQDGRNFRFRFVLLP